ncbi:AAA domain-containing protein [Mycobacteroides salmoniphilum]|uniref:AAA domain-containing protein n=1 Tax=Mycobacteroides salmoniphilum TaxID=404941 RepID=UPI001956D1F4|nr:AAA domain-containing protein [Mycobacteroides salmoniphilum]
MRQKAAEWAKELIQLDGRNALLNFKVSKTATLDLSSSPEHVVSAVLAGQSIRLGEIFTSEESQRDACVRARGLVRKLRGYSEEQGVDVGRLAYGRVVNETANRGGVHPVVALRAPLLLFRVAVQARTAAENDFTLRVAPEPDLNPVLLHCLDRHYGVSLDAEEISSKAEAIMNEPDSLQKRAERIFRLVADSAQEHGVSLRFESLIAVGICNYQKLPMVNDLMSASSLLAQHDLIAALAGNSESRQGAVTEPAYDPPPIDSIRPQDEFLVLDADSSQHQAIATALSGRHVVIDGPPGTGKSQTIANIIAAGSAAGLKILFVAEKRAAIEAVTDRLEAAGLDSLVLDLHQSRINKRSVAEQFSSSLEQLSNTQPVDGDEAHRQLIDRRQQLIDYKDALHKRRDPWDLSTYEVRAILLQLSGIEAPRTRIRQLRMFTKEARKQVSDALWTFVANDGFRILRGNSPWAQAQIRTEDDARQVLAQLDEVRGRSWSQAQSGMEQLLIQAGLPMPQDFSGWEAALQLLSEVSDTVGTLGADIFDAPLHELYIATASGPRRRELHPKLGWRHRRNLLKELRTRTGIKQKQHLHEALGKALQQCQQWQRAAGSPARPGRIDGAAAVGEQYKHLQQQLSAIAMCTKIVHPAQQPIDSVEQTLQALDQDRQLARRLPDLHCKLQLLSSFGLTELLNEICAHNATPDQAVTLLQITLMRELNEEFTLSAPALRNFGTETHDRALTEFIAADEKHKQLAVQRIQRRVAKNVQQASGTYRDELAILRREASKKRRHMPLRQLVDKAPHVMLAIRPCWAMSPLIVSQMLPAQQLFDLVIFDEASQVQPHDAITSIMRGRHLVVAGDDKQLPPTGFFDRSNPDEDTEDTDEVLLGDYESILTTLQPLIPNRRTLRWHYRSQDERLIRFSNEQIYRNKLVTFPGARLDTPVHLEVVDGRVHPGQLGSAATEIARVIELIIEHVRTRPHESLGVITLGQQHRDRLDIALRRELETHPDLNDFFSNDQGPTRRFFIKNIETVQGDERDAIILSLGIGKTAAGAVNRTGFGPLNQEGGERRVNVAVTRAKRRMTVVSSFPPSALEPSDRVTGTELLRRYLESADAGGDTSGIGQLTDTELNGFEQDIYDRLTNRGITVYRQWGISDYRIDFALAHPDEPSRMVLAVEADGDRYHRATSARDRDRLRQQHLERLGWRFHRVWASAWFSDPGHEEQRIINAWETALHDADHDTVTTPAESIPAQETEPAAAAETRRTLPRPNLHPGFTIDNYPMPDLVALFRWLMSDARLLDHEERMKQARDELGFKRRGSRIDDRLHRAHELALRELDQKEH